jgi:hypothetical protein
MLPRVMGAGDPGPMSANTPIADKMLRCRDCSLSAMCGRLRVGKNFLHVCSIGRVRSRVGPVDAPVVTSSNRDLRIHPKIIP